jgi:hypothetical protein
VSNGLLQVGWCALQTYSFRKAREFQLGGVWVVFELLEGRTIERRRVEAFVSD